jgi:dTDP-4-dehydrorhamnose reductase
LALAATEAFGTYHATCQGETTWYEFARLLLRQAGIKVRLTPCATSEYPRPARRPANSVLENRLLKIAGLDLMPPWQAAFRQFWKHYGERL